MYFPSTQAYGTQIAIDEQAFKGQLREKDDTVRGINIYMRSGQGRYGLRNTAQISDWEDDGYLVTKNENLNDSDTYPHIASDWSDWVKINTTSQIYQQAFSVSNSSTNRSLSFSEKNLDTVIKDIYQRILGLNYYTHPTTAGYKHIPSGGSTGQILKWSATGTAKWESESGYTHPTSAGYKHIPSGGTRYDILGYGGSSGTASWIKNTKSCISNLNTSLTNNYYYKILDSTYYNATPNNSCGTALITVNAYDGSEDKNRQTIVFRLTLANGYSGNNKIDIIQNVTTGSAFFDEIIFRTLNGEGLYLVATKTVSAVAVEITADSSLSNGVPAYMAYFAEYNSLDDGNPHGSFNALLHPNSYTSTHRITSGSVTVGTTALRNNEVLIKY